MACEDGPDKLDVGDISEELSISYVGKLDSWQTIEFEEIQTRVFTYEFDVIPNDNNINAVVGLSSSVDVTDYESLSIILKFDESGIIESYNGDVEDHHAEVKYYSGQQYHVRMEVDVFEKIYTISVTDSHLNTFIVARDYTFRQKSANLKAMTLYAEGTNLEKSVTHSVFNIVLTSHSQTSELSFVHQGAVTMVEGAYRQISLKALDPLEGSVSIEVGDLPEYASFEDLGGGEGLLTFQPRQQCDHCDIGTEIIKFYGRTDGSASSLDIMVEVTEPNIQLADVADTEVMFGEFAKEPASPNPSLIDTQIIIGGGVSWLDPENDIYDLTGVFPFEIPDMQPGERFTFAALNMFVKDISPWAVQDYDLYGLPYRTSEFVLGKDYYQGTYDGDPNATALQQRFAYEKTEKDASIFTSSEGGQAVMDYLNAQLDAGAQPGDFVFFRVSVSVDDAPTFGRVILWSADQASKAPRLLYDIN
ncbi:MAG: hypothetical protein R8N23_19175 [Reichenbachiella sp.]|uniref:hypothetical protein n=1 Tax=Reichenbachiella sp. TaxID=2184521 RepID=UPI0029675C6E|nr:hypothetical protein [Reichenbachiella sp.]MDW3212000.1 hypothetical protein [Reichenbachiella sp.]